jgi:serine/threonine protein kinase
LIVPEALRAADPRQVGRYTLLAHLGSGGMGQVFLGRSPGGFSVAVKVIRAELLAADPQFRARFAREIAAARRVNALFTAPVVDADPDAETPWLATAYVPGPSLADAVDDSGPLGAAVVRALAAGLAEGLASIHAVGVVHRDLKPSNVLLAVDGPRIIDFGISRAVEASALTATGAFVGSPAFMSPEQAEGGPVGPPSDVFSLGSVLTFAVTGHGPFQADTVPALFYQVVNAEPALTGVPPELAPLVRQCLAKDPRQRPVPAQVIDQLGPAGPLRNWLPQRVAATLVRYDMEQLGRDAAAAGPVEQPACEPDAPPPSDPATVIPERQPPSPVPVSSRGYQPPTSPIPVSSRGYRPPPGWPDGSRPVTRPSAAGQIRGILPPEYRFGWLSLPMLLFLVVAAFVAPVETLDALVAGFVATVVVSRLIAAVWWARAHGAHGLAAVSVRSLLRDVGGALGLAVLFFATLETSVLVLLPAVGPGSAKLYSKAINTTGLSTFSTTAQAGYFLHLFLLLTVLAVGAVALLRTRGNLGRPLVLPRAARLLNSQRRSAQLAVAGGLVALTAALITLNGGLAPARLPSGAVCSIFQATCTSASKLHIAR